MNRRINIMFRRKLETALIFYWIQATVSIFKTQVYPYDFSIMLKRAFSIRIEHQMHADDPWKPKERRMEKDLKQTTQLTTKIRIRIRKKTKVLGFPIKLPVDHGASPGRQPYNNLRIPRKLITITGICILLKEVSREERREKMKMCIWSPKK